MNTGWTWISLNLQLDDMSVGAVLSSLSLAAGDHIKSQTQFTDYYEGYGFFGQLATLSNEESYRLKLSSATSPTLILAGTPVSLPKTTTLNSGWTWLPVPYLTSVSLTAGAPSFSYAQGDQFKSQTSFSEFYDGYGWFGTLATLQPGNGYSVKVVTGGSAVFQSQRRE